MFIEVCVLVVNCIYSPDCMSKPDEAAVAFLDIFEAEVPKGNILGFTLIRGFESCLCYFSIKIALYGSLDLADH